MIIYDSSNWNMTNTNHTVTFRLVSSKLSFEQLILIRCIESFLFTSQAISVDAPSCCSTSNKIGWGKDLKVQDQGRKVVQKQWLINDCGIFFLKFIEYIILRTPRPQIVQSNMETHTNEVGYSLLDFCEGNKWDGAVHD